MPVQEKYTSRWLRGLTFFIILLLVNISESALALENARQDLLDVSVAVPREFPPYYGVNDHGRPEGFAVDIMDRIAAMSGLRVTYLVEESWSGVENAVKSGRAQIIPNIGVSETRQAWLDYTAPIETFPISIFVREYSDDIRGIGDLIGRKAAAVKFNIGEELLREHVQIELKVFNDPREALLELLAGRVDAVAYPESVFLKLVREAGLEHRIRVSGTPLKEVKRAMGVAKGNMELLKRVDEAVNRFVGTRDYERIFKKWFGEPPPFWSTQRVVFVVFGFGLALFFLMAGWRYYSLIHLNRRLSTTVTDYRRAEEALEESRRRLSEIIDFAPDATFAIDTDGEVIAWNRAIEEMTGVKASDMLGRGNREYSLPFYGIRRSQLIDLVFVSDEEIVNKYHFVKREGDIILAEADVPVRGTNRTLWGKACPLYDNSGNVVGAIESIRDITDRKRTEEALKESQQQLADIINFLPDATFVIDGEGRIIAWNNAIEEMTGVAAPYMLGKGNYEHGLPFYGERRPLLIDLLLKPQMEFEAKYVWIERKDSTLAGETYALIKGNMSYLFSTASVLRDSKGNIVGAIQSIRDITERKRAEEDKEKLEAQLRQSQKMEAIGTLAGGIAHDFNNILSIIIGNAELAELSVAEESRERGYVDAVLKGAHRAKDLVQQILVFSRMEGKLERQPVDLGSAIGETLKFLRASLPSTIEMRRNVPEKSLMAWANTSQIHQLLTNLCTNASHAMEEAGGILEVSLAEANLNADSMPSHLNIKPGPYIRLTVSDTGQGMDSWTLERIFDPYFTTKKVGKGSGLGLSLVQGIVSRHQGAITVHSQPGKGTVFHIYLPGIEGKATAEVEMDKPLPKGTERILFVDDETALADLGQMGLQLLGYEVLAKTSSVEALEVFSTHPERFDLVITDYTMPHMTGKDLAEAMMRIRPDIRIILCTGFNERITEAKARDMGIRAFLMKPTSMRDMAEAVRRVLDTGSGYSGASSVPSLPSQ